MLKNITFNAEQELIRRACELALSENTTLNEEFRRWLEKYVERPRTLEAYALLIKQYEYVQSGRSFTRDEMNER